jgi:CheY-like chemotaxis protein
LVIDDDDDMRLVISQSLEAIGYDVRSAGGGEDGLALLDRDPADVLVVDFAMPGMNGVEVARAARGRLRDIEVVFVSGYADTTAIEKGWGEGSILVRKPFRIEALHQAIQLALAGRDAARAVGA